MGVAGAGEALLEIRGDRVAGDREMAAQMVGLQIRVMFQVLLVMEMQVEMVCRVDLAHQVVAGVQDRLAQMAVIMDKLVEMVVLD
jgi:hypothetical protein